MTHTKKPKKKIILFVSVLLLFFTGTGVLYFVFPKTTFNLLVKMERGIGGFTQKHIDLGKMRIYYLEGGGGEPLLLFHGFGANKDNWTRIGRYLTPHFRVIAPDLPGFGESGLAMDGTYTVGRQAERVHALIQALGLQKFHLGGSSMGGNIAGVYAARHPDRLLSLWLVAPGGVISSEPSEMFELLRQEGKNPLVAASVEDYDRLLDFVFVNRPFIPHGIKQHLTREAMAQETLNRIIFAQLLKNSDRSPIEEILTGNTVPTLIVWGDKDRVLHPSGAGILKSVMPNAAVRILRNVGHLPMIEDPESTAELYLRFLNKPFE